MPDGDATAGGGGGAGRAGRAGRAGGPPTDALPDLSGRVAVVTGGGRGIGRAITLGLAAAGATVVPSAWTPAEVESVAEEARDLGVEARGITADVTDDGDVDALVEETVEAFGSLDVLVDNAGFNPGDALGDPAEIDAGAVDDVLDVNLRGAFRTLRAADPYLKDVEGERRQCRQRGGRGRSAEATPVRRLEARPRRAHEERGDRLGPGGAGERGRAGLRRDRPHRDAPRGRAAPAVDPRPDPAGPLRRAGRDRRPGRVPRQRRRELRHGRDAGGRRRLDGAVSSNRALEHAYRRRSRGARDGEKWARAGSNRRSQPCKGRVITS